MNYVLIVPNKIIGKFMTLIKKIKDKKVNYEFNKESVSYTHLRAH